jgi:hypothetical protein
MNLIISKTSKSCINYEGLINKIGDDPIAALATITFPVD